MSGHRWTREEVVLALKRWAAEHGCEPTHNGWRPAPAGMPGRDTVMGLFGGWRPAMLACGFSAPGPGKGNKPRLIDRSVRCANPRCGDPIGARGYSGRCERCAGIFTRFGRERCYGYGIVVSGPRGDVARRLELSRRWRRGEATGVIAREMGYASGSAVLARVCFFRARFPAEFPYRRGSARAA